MCVCVCVRLHVLKCPGNWQSRLKWTPAVVGPNATGEKGQGRSERRGEREGVKCNGLSAGNSQMDARSARADRNCIYAGNVLRQFARDCISPEIAEAAGQVGNEAIRIGRDRDRER